MHKLLRLSPLLAISLVACTSIPTGPSMTVLPGSGRSFDQFRHDDYSCREFAHEQTGGSSPDRASISSGATSAAVGAGLGAAAGAAMGGGRGAAIGAGLGLLAGALTGTRAAEASGSTSQQRYDMRYAQCMYGKGHRVPIGGQVTDGAYGNGGNPNPNPYTNAPSPAYSPPPTGSGGSVQPPPPPPPPGIPPPPPPR
ncbi:hypothetical protein SAMN05216332_10929 [Nitrosospira briensis]|nr:YMGG-like glycine zipper-containing protein [Nitrosospira briensis]SFO25959.1 hypothetical protein SAMN05216332_10929 [Nitrosospira briensis]